jgi:hypothetical protein
MNNKRKRKKKKKESSVSAGSQRAKLSLIGIKGKRSGSGKSPLTSQSRDMENLNVGARKT